MLAYLLAECIADVSADVLIISRVVPNDVSLSFFSCACGWAVGVVGEGVHESAGFYGVFVDGFRFVEFCFVAG